MFCGLTRSVEKCFELNFAQAVKWHLFGPVFFIGYLFLLLKYLPGFLFGYAIELFNFPLKLKNGIFFFFAALAFIYWILRLLDVPGCVFPN